MWDVSESGYTEMELMVDILNFIRLLEKLLSNKTQAFLDTLGSRASGKAFRKTKP